MLIPLRIILVVTNTGAISILSGPVLYQTSKNSLNKHYLMTTEAAKDEKIHYLSDC
jgi:hypothetical protein